MPKLTLPSLSLPSLPKKASSNEQYVVPDAVKADPMSALRETAKPTKVNSFAARAAQLREHVTPLRAGLAALALFVLIWPGTFILLFVLTLFAVVGAFVLIGADQIWDKVALWAKSYTARHPEKKDAVYDRLDDFAMAWDNLLDRLPEGLVDGLYMPDFSNIEETEREHDAIVTDRLNRMQSQG